MGEMKIRTMVQIHVDTGETNTVQSPKEVTLEEHLRAMYMLNRGVHTYRYVYIDPTHSSN